MAAPCAAYAALVASSISWADKFQLLSYRHIYHAGNFADVFKHAILVLLLRALQRKDKPLCYLETHAGAGRYDLHSEQARKNAEFKGGIHRLWRAKSPPPEIEDYLLAVRAINGGQPGRAPPRYYPGSPVIARSVLRPQDRMVLSELHPADYELLQAEFREYPRVVVHRMDGYQALKAFLPPPERRGLVLMDPAFELPGELDRVVEGLILAHRRWESGVFALWYPILPRLPLSAFFDSLRDSGIRKILLCELCPYPEDNPVGLNGTGMVIVNPPWRVEEHLQILLPWLWSRLTYRQQGRHRVTWLVPE